MQSPYALRCLMAVIINPFKPIGISNYYQLTTSMVGRLYFLIIFRFQDTMYHFVSKQWILDQTPHFVASDLGMDCLSMFHKKNIKHKWVTTFRKSQPKET